MSTSKEDLRRLVDELPEKDLDTVRIYLEHLRDTDDLLLRKLMEAPLDDEGELSEEALADLQEAREEARRGEGRPWEDVRRELMGE